MEDNLIVFKGKKDGITVVLDEQASFENVREVYKNKISDSKFFFGDIKTNVDFKGRELSAKELEELLAITSEHSDIKVLSVEEEISNETKEKYTIINVDISKCRENDTFYYKGILRSGQNIFYDGSIVIYGEVNPGAVVKAKGDITVFGYASGFLHAGCDGDEQSVIFANCLSPLQLKIGKVISCFPEDMRMKMIRESRVRIEPSYAFLKDSQIYIKPIN